MRTKAPNSKAISLALAAGLAATALAGCSSTSEDAGSGGNTSKLEPPKVKMLKELGDGEGAVSILAWPGFAEDGSTDKAVDWVKPFEEQTGCKARVKYFGTSDEAVSLMKSGQYDVVSASGDASLRLVFGGDVAPVNTDLVPSYASIAPFLKNKAWNSVEGQMYGVPNNWGANVLMYNTKEVKPAPTSWSSVFGDSGRYKGKVTAYDSPIYIADAALWLMNDQPALGIKNPYALDDKQLDAAVDLLKVQRPNVSEYWSDYTKEVSAFKTGSSVIGTTWQTIANIADDEAPVATVLPEEGATGWSDTWMVSAKADHPNCAYEWMNYAASPPVNAQIAEYIGAAPSNLEACEETSDKKFCQTYHASDRRYAAKIWYWTTPTQQCLDGRETSCTDYATWTTKWQEIKG